MTSLMTLAACAAMLTAPARAEDSPHGEHMTECAKTCAACLVQCEMNFDHCFKLVAAGKVEHAKAMRLSGECAEFCALSAKLSARNSELSVAACEACAKACAACGVECAKFDMPEMKACAAECQKCEASCRAMVKMMGGHKH